ncbi:very low-density lipoprotein receptor-like [Mytilus trossulus]|uniref:very low-density lipoprotein receptor-like n=1 Tax=Mytilus trossulus TaxID=6551 RepID=UPI00300490DF
MFLNVFLITYIFCISKAVLVEGTSECSSHPCQHGGVCNDLTEEYTCACSQRYTCACSQRYTGLRCETDTCGGHFTSLTGSFETPRFWNPFRSRQLCRYLISVPAGYKIKLTITKLSISSYLEFLFVYEGTRTSDVLILGLGNYDRPTTAETRGNNMLVTFTSDFEYSRSGFQASYITKDIYCPSGQIRCSPNDRSLGCVSAHKFCDESEDCEYGYDERNCQYNNTCGPNQFRCRSGQCIHNQWKCDGTRKCTDGSDELASICTEPTWNTCTDWWEFECSTDRQCIYKKLKCDGFEDCFDGSDERNCP